MKRDSIFWNNSYALFVSTDNFGRHPGSKYPIIIHENNTFVKNIYDLLKPDGAAAIYFGKGKSLVSSCRFFDNGPGQNPYMGVVKISEMASVTFFNSYFENRQTKALSNQLFASGNRLVKFAGENTFNLVALKESQTVFVRIPTALSNGVIMRKNFKILCPHGYKLHAQR
jgi:nicotinic acid phosphoribosyltransferase